MEEGADGKEDKGEDAEGEVGGVAGCSNSIFLLKRSWGCLQIGGGRTRRQ